MEQLPFQYTADAKGIELSRVSGDLDFSDEEEFNAMFLQNDPDAKRMHEQLKIDNVQAWIKDERIHIEKRFELREKIFNALTDKQIEMPFETLQLTPLTINMAQGQLPEKTNE